ncbi:MAG: hypothetical protein NWP79_09825, partial [Paracoccaceae bacterium]|nr:hypothetical protein [Paracoccaceae bacterium]
IISVCLKKKKTNKQNLLPLESLQNRVDDLNVTARGQTIAYFQRSPQKVQIVRKYAHEIARSILHSTTNTNRPHYHFVEKYCSRTRECGRQCLFIVPSKDDIDFDELEKDIGAFRHVMD